MTPDDIDGKVGYPVSFFWADTDAADNSKYAPCFIATRPWEILSFSICFTTQPSANPANFVPAILTGTTTVGSGTKLRDFIDLHTLTANTVYSYKTTQFTAGRQLKTGDRIELQVGTLTGMRNFVLTFYLKPMGSGSFK